MAEGWDWDAQKILDMYILDYMRKKNMHDAAENFVKEAQVCLNPVVIDAPDGFLTEWWSIFWDMYSSKRWNYPVSGEESSSKVHPYKQANSREESSAKVMENLLETFRHTVPKTEINKPRFEQFPVATEYDKMMTQPMAHLLAAKMYEEERHKGPVRDLDSDTSLLDIDKLALTMTSPSYASHQLQPIPSTIHQCVVREDRCGKNFNVSNSQDSTLLGVPKARNTKPEPSDAGKCKVNTIPLNGWPSTGMGPFSPGMGHQVLNSLVPALNQQQFQTPASSSQHDLVCQLLAQAQEKSTRSVQGISNLGHVLNPGNDISQAGGQVNPMEQTSPQSMMVPIRQAEEQIKPLIIQSEKQQKKNRPKQQQLRETGKKKYPSNVQPGESALVCRTPTVQCGRDTGMDVPLDENVESFLSHDDESADVMSTSFSSLRQNSSSWGKVESKGFSFEEVGTLTAFRSKVLCCHFSTDGKSLASAGHERKVFIWNMNTLTHDSTVEGHSHLITDVRFRPNSNILATSSFDRTVQLWDAARPKKSLLKLIGHAEHVMSLDFHPRKVDLLCSCDSNEEVRLWNVNQCSCVCIFKGASRQVRFQPRSGNLLAAASGNTISLIDIETQSPQYHLEGHVKDVHCISWDTSGKYIASVSEDSTRVWSILSGGKCINELHSNGNKFETCTFHPGYSQLLVIGSYQTLELWNPTHSNSTMTFSAHKGMISALADSPETDMIASASHDPCVKLWK